MKFFFTLDQRKNQERKNGFPVVVDVRFKKQRLRFALGVNLLKKNWDEKNKLPKQTSKYYVVVKKKQLLAESLVLDALVDPDFTIQDFKNKLLNIKQQNTDSFYEFAAVRVAELKQKNKKSNAVVYENAIEQLKKFRSTLYFTDLNYLLLTKFKDWQFTLGNKKNTVSAYLRTYRAIYNEAVKRNVVEDTKPFKDVFVGVTVKSNRTKKRYLDKTTILQLEKIKGLPMAQQRSLDLWLLLFYFGGQDLKDVYYLEQSQIFNNRVYFIRGKLAAGFEFDLKIVPKAQKIIDKYKTPGKYLFGWRKDYDGYRTFRDNFRRNLLKVIDNYNKDTKNKPIQVLPKGGNVTIKVARHSFATIGKQLFVDTDLLRELMGHERSDVDTIYKDKYPEKIRDKAHLKIIQ